MKPIFAIAALVAIGACTATPEMIEAQKGRCTQLGYKPGTPEHAQCAERGTSQQQSAQNAAVVGAGQAAVQTALTDALMRSWF